MLVQLDMSKIMGPIDEKLAEVKASVDAIAAENTELRDIIKGFLDEPEMFIWVNKYDSSDRSCRFCEGVTDHDSDCLVTRAEKAVE